MKAYATDKTSTRSRRSVNVEQAIDILAEVLGSREEVLATLSEILVADCDFTDKQRREIYEMIKRLHGDSPYSEN